MDVVGDVFLVLGGAWSLLGAVGVLKFDDVFSRMHAGTKAATLGVLLVIVGGTMQFEAGTSAKLVLVLVLIYLTVPVGAHLVGRAVYHERGEATLRIDTVDELADADRGAPDEPPS